MSAHLVAILAAIAAAQARIAAMQVANAQVDLQASPAPYGEECFRVEAAHLDALSNDARNAG